MHRLSWMERSAWCAGTAFMLAYLTALFAAEIARAQAVAAFRNAEAAKVSGHALQFPEIDQSLWSEERIRAFAASASHKPNAAAVLRIPSLQLEVPVYEDTTELNLNLGAGHIAGTAPVTRPGNVGIAGHRDGFFRKLKDLRIDSVIYLESGGRAARFRVSELRIVDPSDVSVLAPTDVPSITLVTCYPFYFVGPAPQRYVVRAELDRA